MRICIFIIEASPKGMRVKKLTHFIPPSLHIPFFEISVTSDEVITTYREVTLRIGTTGILPCITDRDLYNVQWNRGLNGEEHLVALDLYFDPGKRAGPGFDEGLYYIDDNFSLVINKVEMSHMDRFFCEVSDKETEKQLKNYTDVFIIGKATILNGSIQFLFSMQEPEEVEK